MKCRQNNSIICKYVFYIMFVLVIATSVISCLPLIKQSKIITNNIQVGMTKNEVESHIAGPYKISYELSDSGKYYDYWYYKERIYIGNSWFLIETILIFDKDILFEVKQGEERIEGTSIQ